MSFIVVILGLLLLGCSNVNEPKQGFYELDGVLFYEYHLHGATYWPAKTYFIDDKGRQVDFFSSKNTQKEILFHCENDWEAQFEADKDADTIIKLPYYQDQRHNEGITGYHKGGDLYYKTDQSLSGVDTSKIIISFRIKGNGFIYNSICDEFLSAFRRNPDCPVKSNVSIPFAILNSLKEAYSLNENEMRDLGLKRREESTFLVTHCE